MHKTWWLVLMLAACMPAAQVKAQFGQIPDLIGESLKEQADNGDAEAQFQLGLRLVTGQSDDKTSKAQGAAWIQKAAKQGHEKAMHVLGTLYEEGIGVAEDFKLAAQWHEKAAEKGLAEAQLSLALLYDQGKGVEQDASIAAEWAMKSASQGHAPAQALYGLKLVRGDGTPKNASKAAVWFLKSAKQGNGFAQRQLAYLYYTGNGVKLDYARCEAWYRRAVQNENDVWAKNDLAWFLSTCPDDGFHKGEEAVSIAKAAIKQVQAETGEQRHEMIDTMAAALARNGQFGEAVLWQRRSLALLKEDGSVSDEERKQLMQEFEERLNLYTGKKPYADKPTEPETQAEPLHNDDVLDGGNDEPTPPPGKKPSKKKDNSVT
jgi:TPR repeat protein